MASLGSYLSGFGLRVPDVSKLWRGAEADDVDGKVRLPVYAKLEACLFVIREASLWTRPWTSVSVVAAVHLLFAYLSRTSNTPIYLASWATVVAILYTTWVNTIWPEIRAVDDDGDDAPVVHDGHLLDQRTREARTKVVGAVRALREYRSRRPGLFCLASSAAFAALGLLGTQVTALGLFYYTLVAYLTVPGALRYMNACGGPSAVSSGPSRAKPDAPDSPLKFSHLTDQASTLFEHVRSSLASAVSNVGTGSHETETDDDDDLKDYLPEVDDERVVHILDGAQRNVPGPDDDSLDYSSLMSGLGSVMPDVDLDEPDTGRVYPALLPFNKPKKSFPSSNNDEDQNEGNSLIQAALSSPYLSADLMPSFDSEEIERDDFEIISEAELAEAMRK